MGLVVCQKCGESNSEFNVRCASCGARLTDEPFAPSPSAPPGVEETPDPWVGRTVSHYRILARLGRGGMGVVYRALDSELRRPVALKFLSPALEDDPQARARFLREARAASALDHPNIGTIYEIGQEGKTSFIAMALYEGETLRQRIERGQVPFDEAERILAQLIAALGAAHVAGILHRDVKPSNVMLTASGPLKLLDFGLAKPLTAAAPSLDSLTTEGAVVGTITYMAPEQIDGGTVDHRADIWALGVLAYEMLGGQTPFVGTTHLTTANRILNDEPEPLRRLRPDVPAHLDTLVTQSLRKAPADRPQSMAELGRYLAGTAPPPAPARPPPPPRRPRRVFVLAGAGLVCAGLALGGVRLARRAGSPRPPAAAKAGPRRGVAVLGLKNASGREDAAWMAGAFAEMLRTELAAGEKLRVVPGENVARMRVELALADSDGYAPDTLERIRRNLGTDLVVVGSYLAIGDKGGGRIRLDLRVQEAAGGETLASVAETAGEADLFDLVSRTGAELRRQLGIGVLTASETAGLRASEPSRPEVVRLYSAGLERLRVSDALAARDLLAQATVAEPDFPLAHAALSEAWSALGNDARAVDEAHRALDLSSGLPREERLSVEARYHLARKEWDKAIDRWRALFGFFPDDLEYGLNLADAEIHGSKPADALETLAALKKLPPPAGDDPRIWLTEASAAEATQDFAHEQAAAGESARRAEAQGSRLVAARARLREAWARGNQGDREHAIPDLEKVRKTFEEAGDRAMVAHVISRMGTLYTYKGNAVESRRLFEEGLQLQRALGNRSGEAQVLGQLANIISDQGEQALAVKYYQQAIAVLAEIGDKGSRGSVLNAYGTVLSDMGDGAGARKVYEEALQLFRTMGDDHGVAIVLGNLASQRYRDGDMDGARTLREEALTLARKLGDKRTAVYALNGLSVVLSVKGDFYGAQKRLEEAVSLAKEIGDRVLAARVQVALATAYKDGGKPDAAEPLLREAIEVFRAEKLGSFHAHADNVLSHMLLEDNKSAEAQAAVDDGLVALGNAQTDMTWRLAQTAARVKAHSGKPADRAAAVKMLDQTLAGATAAHAETGTLLDVRIERAGNLPEPERRRALVALVKEAKAMGYAAMSKRAAELLEKR